MDVKAKYLILALEDLSNSFEKYDDEMIYDEVFRIWKDQLEPTLESLGIHHTWCDPDTSYEEDVRAFVSSLEDVKERLKLKGEVTKWQTNSGQ